ncbi:MAG: 4-hydroxy-tetrahydrodipicolinate reductase [Candidatus Muirbacterium halophilum]|nr:4-hydroxy-tetrahydrodipicolinate reductase [Candidatus Muirbacterium halophilum]MCK9474494.1 4-hydroxy-tetrahydrodipicolinate reductase [Candidatus Muirbacterium halophilum]
MKISLIGFGKMGKMIKEKAISHGHEISSIIDPFSEQADFKDITSESVCDADVCIEFTNPDCALSNIKKLIMLDKHIVVGTTGWYKDINKIQAAIEKSSSGFVYGSNFSPGMHVFKKITDYSSKLFAKISDYDVAGIEIHHSEKIDSPSGTANVLSDIIIKNNPIKQRLLTNSIDRKVAAEEFQFTSVRTGKVPGIHKIMFDSDADTVEISHTARNREGFALGAIIAAEFINRKTGFYNIETIFDEIMEGK